MKTVTQLALTGLVTALLATGSAFAGDTEVRTIDNHHGSVTYLPRESSQKKVTTIALFNQRAGSGAGSVKRETETKRNEVVSHNVTTPHGTVIYYGPAD